MTSAGPVFIHSLHRSGSTYIFHAFRRAKAADSSPLYTCFQEPLHELAHYARENPDLLLEPADRLTQLLRHPKLEEPYFRELFELHHRWNGILAPESIYADYFGRRAIRETAAYFQALIGASGRRTVIQECRTSLRIAALKERLGGVHIHLWRNPWDQWWSLKVSDYFDAVHQIILNAHGAPEAVRLLKEHIAFESYPETDVAAQLKFYRTRRLAPEASYLTAFMLLMLGMIEGESAADFDINIDLLSIDAAYRERIVENLKDKEVEGLNFSDCKSPQGLYGKSAEAFFAPLEERVFGWLEQGGYAHRLLERVRTRYRQAAPNRSPRRKRSDDLLDQLAGREALVLSVEGREAAALRQLAEFKAKLASERRLRRQLERRLAGSCAGVSWRLTAPARWISGHLRRWFGRVPV